MRFWIAMTILSMAMAAIPGYAGKVEKQGLSYAAEFHAEKVRLLVDETWVDAEGKRHVDQEVFGSVFEMVDEAEQFILLDFFLVNDFLYEPGPGMRPLSQELTDRLIAKRKSKPGVEIIFVTDPVNTVYGSIESPHFSAMEEAGVKVVWTELNKLRDSNPLFSKPWRLLGKPWGTGPGRTFGNPMGPGRISMRSAMKLLNFKANHRKLVVTEKSLLVTSANPHSASSAHWNMALRVDGAGQSLVCESESSILKLSGAEVFRPTVNPQEPSSGHKLELLTEGKIKDKVLKLLANAAEGARIDLSMFYFSDKDIIDAFIRAHERGCKVRIILDPNKDAFGRVKNGIPNRQTAYKLVKAGIPLRWADTHGEQCHAKTLYVEHPGRTATLLLGSSNFTRRNLDNFNVECDLALTAPLEDDNMVRARQVFERWWSNPEGRFYSTEYETYADPSRCRRIRAWLIETTGMGTF